MVLVMAFASLLIGLSLYTLYRPERATPPTELGSAPVRGETETKASKSAGRGETSEKNPALLDTPNRAVRSGREIFAEGSASHQQEKESGQARDTKSGADRASRIQNPESMSETDVIEILKELIEQNPQEGEQDPSAYLENILGQLPPEAREKLDFEATDEDFAASPDLGKSHNLVVTNFTISSAAQTAGIELGDEIVSYFGEPVENITELQARQELAYSQRPTWVEIVVERNDGRHELKIRPGSIGVLIEGR